jgi:hypothetical protein
MEMAKVLRHGATLRKHLLASTGFSIVSLLHWTALALAVFKEQRGGIRQPTDGTYGR